LLCVFDMQHTAIINHTTTKLDRGPGFASTAPRVGARVGGYRLRRLLGRGGRGAVYLATKAGHRVAIKIMDDNLSNGVNMVAQTWQRDPTGAKRGHLVRTQAAEQDGVLTYHV